MPSWPTPGDRREDHATAAGSAIGVIYAQAELIIIAAIASLARKVAAGTMLPQIAARHLQQTVNRVLSTAAPQARADLNDAMTSASAQVRETLAPTLPLPRLPVSTTRQLTSALQPAQDLAALIDSATDTAAQSAQASLTAITTAAAKAADTAGAIPPPGNPYTTALDKAFGR